MENHQYISCFSENLTAYIILNRPEKHNALNPKMIKEMLDALMEFEKNQSLRFLILRGVGNSFCSGADLAWFGEFKKKPKAQLESETRMLSEMLFRLHHSRLISIAAVHGNCIAGGLGLAAACDFILAEENATFALTEIKAGLIPAIISPYIYEKIGMQNTKFLMLSGKKFSTDEAMKYGLIFQKATSNETLDEIVEKLLNIFSQGAPKAAETIKHMLNLIGNNELTKSDHKVTASFLAQKAQSEEAIKGITAFFENKKVDWNK